MSETPLALLVQALYALPTCGVGGPLHIIVDDLNVDDRSIAFCWGELGTHWSIQEAAPKDVPVIRSLCAAILNRLQGMSEDARHVALGGEVDDD